MGPPTAQERVALSALQSLSESTASVIQGASSLISFTSVSSCTTCGVSRVICKCTRCNTCHEAVPSKKQYLMRQGTCKTCLNDIWRAGKNKKKVPVAPTQTSTDLNRRQQSFSDTDSTTRDTMSAGDTSMSETDTSSNSCSPSKTCVQWSDAHVLAL